MTFVKPVCLNLNVALAFVGYFPSSPISGQLAFHTETVMKAFRELNMNCRVTPHRFCNLLKAKIDACGPNDIKIYARFLESQRVYGFMMTQIELGNLNLHDAKRSKCPACEENPDGIIFMAGDGNMSFQGKHKPNGIDPLYKDLWFHPDLTHDEIKADKRYSKNCQDCSQFKADPNGMDALRKETALHHKGLFGTMCKHRIPGYFIFMTHGGEAYIYFFKMILYYLKKPINRLNAKYDIGCNYKRYLKVSMFSLLSSYLT